MNKRGKVLRDAKRGQGLLFIEGQQFPFSVSDAWRSEQLPAPGMCVEVEFGSAGEVLSIRPITETQNAKVEGRASRIFSRLLASIRRVHASAATSISLESVGEGNLKARERKSVGFKS